MEQEAKTTFPMLLLATLPPPLPHTPISLSLSLSLPLSLPLSHCLSILEPPAAQTVRGRDSVFLTQHQSGGKKHTHTHSHTCTRRKRRWTEAPAVACPLAAVRHVGGGGALLAVPCPLQPSKHLPSPPTTRSLALRLLRGWLEWPGRAGDTRRCARRGLLAGRTLWSLIPPPLQAGRYKADLWSAPQMHAHIGGHVCVDRGSSSSLATVRRTTTETRR